jgi:hypothetical protein
VFA